MKRPTQLFGPDKAKRTLDGRWKLLLWAMLISLVCGAIDFGEPIEKTMRNVRNTLRSQPASGDIVVVGIDDKSLAEVGQWPWPRRYHAKMLDTLLAKGARRVFFDYMLVGRSTPQDDTALATSLAKAEGRAVLPARFNDDLVTGKRTYTLPLPDFARKATLANINVNRDPWGEVWSLPYATDLLGRSFPSFGAMLANRQGVQDKSFPIDYSTRFRSVPHYSAIDVINNVISSRALAGKDVVIGLSSDRLGDVYSIPGQYVAPGVYVQVLAAETLKRGTPATYSWIWAFLGSLVVTASYVFGTRRLLPKLVIPLGLAMLAVPLVLEAKLIFVDTVPALLLFGIVVSRRGWRRMKERSAATNVISGLPNLNALKRGYQGPSTQSPLIAVRVRNYSEIAATLPPSDEKILITEITRRLELGAGGSTLFQGEEGVFLWLARPGNMTGLGDEIEGLHAILTGPVAVGNRSVDLTVSFGVDHNCERDLSNRIGSALLACDEAAAENHKWKSYDPERLRDAEWRLSLLGRLDSAIDNGEIWVAYQPKLDVRTGRIVGAEALARWLHPEKGPIAPDEFIQAAEQHNRIEKLTVFVLQDAIKAAAAINARGTPFSIAVNLSARVLDSPLLCPLIEELLASHSLPPEMLIVEVTESAAILGDGHSVTMLDTLRNWGVGVSIDDYGTGFSTLEYLRAIPATEIKIDRSFVSAMDRSQSDRLMVASTIQLAHSLGRTVVAEGVETQSALTLLGEMGCDVAQGYFIGRPMKLVGLSRLLIGEQRLYAA